MCSCMNTTVLTCIIQVQDTETIIIQSSNERRIVIFYLLPISSLDDKDDAIEDEVFDDRKGIDFGQDENVLYHASSFCGNRSIDIDNDLSSVARF